MNAINAIGPLGVPPLPPQPGAAAIESSSFRQHLLESIDEVNAMQQEAERAVEGLATGQDVNPADVLTAVQKADLAFKLVVQIRNKLVAAYQEVQNIRV